MGSFVLRSMGPKNRKLKKSDDRKMKNDIL